MVEKVIGSKVEMIKISNIKMNILTSPLNVEYFYKKKLRFMNDPLKHFGT